MAGRMPAMDSLSQIALGAAVGVAVMGRRTAVWKAAAWGALAGTLPDLDVLIDHGDPIRNMVLHRAQSHAPFWLTLFSLPFAALVARLSGEWAQWRRWWLAMWLVLVTHPLLDAMTIYGTQLALPFSDHPYGVGSIFIIDPLYTLPLLIGAVWALVAKGGARGLAANAVGLAVSTLYLGWTLAAQSHVQDIARMSLAEQGLQADQVLVSPVAFSSVLWRVLVMQGDNYHEGFYSLFDASRSIHLDRFDQGAALAGELPPIDGVRRIAAFSKGYYKLHQQDARILITDLRMGQEPAYVFTFAVAQRQSPAVALEPAQQVGARPDLARALPWLWRRTLGQALPPPR